MSSVLSAVIFITVMTLLLLGVASTVYRSFRYRREGLKQPVLLGRDRDLLIGLAAPFVLIAAIRAFGLQESISGESGPHLWYVLATGLPPIYALARYDYFELRVIDRQGPSLDERSTMAAERTADATERIADAKDERKR